MSRPEPTSWESPSAAAFGMSSPSTVADKSIETTSPTATGRSTAVRVPNRVRNDCSSASTSSSPISIGSTETVSALRSGGLIFGRMSTSAVNCRSWPYSFLVTSMLGRPSGWTSDSATACPYRLGSASLTI
ncbi:Uncharacterised protein [Mycobacterium tuberculosis]|uniref:Uncharacterized protein n=1 Tax=Mycobacterium tuberculosis TaxID=1773 RepID=A0A655A915_MYCTX|nr:Uncharacterised protein [Mycobacterium tuberculosis]CKS17131.1 Uncharacterised protein [Mycobacterium tuberculosis]CKS21031.1 Uncharacterised protein [Mycobacterium tuberculosis]CKT76471.1 Uncharacterised protein [Mycobacterium tuberculosis]CNV59590.1 Uncharacterised protein [Mycobacterium tuberculosis]